MPGGEEDQEEEGSVGTFSHYGEFQALMRKWINREVRAYLPCVKLVPPALICHDLHFICPFSSSSSSSSSLVWCSCVGELSATVPL